LYAHEKYDVSTGDFIKSSDSKDIIGISVMGATAEAHYFGDHPDISFHKGLDKALPGYRINFTSYSDNQRIGLAMVSSPQMAPGLFWLDRDAGQFSPMYSSRPKLQGSPMSDAQPIMLTARDGVTLEGYFTPAAGVEGTAPLIVMPHGGPHGIRDFPYFNTEIKMLAARGYSVLQVNFRGSGGYGINFEQLGYRHWGTSMIDDIVDATHYVVEQGLVSADKICIMGGSYGGYAAMMAIARYPDVFKCGVGISGVYDLNLMRKSDIPFFPGGDVYLERVIGSDEAELSTNSPVTLAGNIKAAIFLAHGGRDKRVRPENAEAFKKALEKAGKEYEWFEVVSAGHGFAQPENREKLYQQLFDFFEKHLH
jgi:dipeptidyl aminopeptidase/acylaminoacyl peptidase